MNEQIIIDQIKTLSPIPAVAPYVDGIIELIQAGRLFTATNELSFVLLNENMSEVDRTRADAVSIQLMDYFENTEFDDQL